MRHDQVLAAALVATLAVFPAYAQDFSLPPTYGQASLDANFQPDPHTVAVVAGGQVNAGNIGFGCSGGIANAPDYRLVYGGNGIQLIFSVSSSIDTTLVINDPNEVGSATTIAAARSILGFRSTTRHLASTISGSDRSAAPQTQPCRSLTSAAAGSGPTPGTKPHASSGDARSGCYRRRRAAGDSQRPQCLPRRGRRTAADLVHPARHRRARMGRPPRPDRITGPRRWRRWREPSGWARLASSATPRWWIAGRRAPVLPPGNLPQCQHHWQLGRCWPLHASCLARHDAGWLCEGNRRRQRRPSLPLSAGRQRCRLRSPLSERFRSSVSALALEFVGLKRGQTPDPHRPRQPMARHSAGTLTNCRRSRRRPLAKYARLLPETTSSTIVNCRHGLRGQLSATAPNKRHNKK